MLKSILPLLRFNLVLLAGILICVALYYGRQIFILLSFSILFSMLMVPVANKMEAKGIGRIWSTVFCTIIVILTISVFLSIIGTQIYNISEKAPQIEKKFEIYLNDLQAYVHKKTGISPRGQIELLKEQAKSFAAVGGALLRDTLMSIAGIIVWFVMMLVFMFLFLLQREKYKIFFANIFRINKLDQSEEVIDKIVKVSHSYLTGMLLSMLIITAMYSTGFLIVGLENAVLLAAIAAALIIIPYVGAFIGGSIPFLMAMLTADSIEPALKVAGVMIVVQTIDNNFIEPYIIGGEVRLSAVATILALFIGGSLWGIPGVVLFLPMAGITKVIFDHTEPLKPYGYLIGDQEEKTPSRILINYIRKIFRKS
jgi:predicted PurR-regulated permease PerM